MTNLDAAPATRLTTVASLQDVRFRWPSSTTDSLFVPQLAIGRGERVFLHGQSGSGKSTLLSLIGGVIVPQAGRLEVLGQDLAVLPGPQRDRLRAEHLGFVFQQFNLIPYLSARENILLACRFSRGRRARIAEAGHTPQAEAARLARHLDLADEALDRQAAELSVGQQQRVAACRALIGRPSMVLADEPTSALDADRQRAFLDLLLAECGAVGAALLFVSHDLSLAERFDRHLSMREINLAGNEGSAA